MTAVNPVYMSPDLASVIEVRVGATNSPADIERVTVRWREGLKAIPDQLCRSAHADSIFGMARSLVLGPGWEHIGQFAFDSWWRATSMVLPESLRTIDQYAFRAWQSMPELILPSGVTTIGQYAFDDWRSATSLTFPDSLTSIGGYAFRGWQSMSELVFPAHITSIAVGGIVGWSSATKFTLEEGHTGVGFSAQASNPVLGGWTSLRTVDLPSTLTNVSTYFTQASSTQLAAIIVRAVTPPTIASITFGLPAGARFYVPDGSVEAYKAAPQWVTFADRILPLSELP